MSLQGRGTLNIDDENNLYYNPFAGASQSSVSSAVSRKDGGGGIAARPVYRRRGSESSAARRTRNDHDPWQEGSSTFGAAHSRSRTADSAVGSSSGAKFHPLESASHSRSAGAGSSGSSITDTRPRLKRLLSDLGPGSNGKDDSYQEASEEVVSRPSNAALKEKVVIVHEVTATDSLAGVALKYGISMADLRKANTLWTSDPIHLRKVLYIPLDRSHKAKDILLSQLESHNSEGTLTGQNITASPIPGRDEDITVLSSSSSLTIRRVPASQLSFFPPASHTARTQPNSLTLPRSTLASRKRDPIPIEAAPSLSSAHSASSSSSLPSTSAFASALQAPPTTTSSRAPKPSLTSLFSALPINRISFDSGTSTPSQASEDQEHELDDVSQHSSSSNREGRPRALSHRNDYLSLRGSRTSSQAPFATRDGFELSPFVSSTAASAYSDRSSVVKSSKKALTQPAVHYTSPERNSPRPEAIRTSQPQPYPAMQLPLRPRRET
ncbi:hypothetical protein BDW22DRAFT_560997 [Trametopsis cervina]|nr:hypothetical protein BDW22DRAFT_560997 [Trametopsis cervina]